MGFEIEYYCVSHIGNHRKNNQDNFYCNGNFLYIGTDGTKKIIHGFVKPSDTAIFGVFDGMGGEEKGEVAAYIAAKNIAKVSFKDNPKETFNDYCRMANSEICDYTIQHQLTSMGTTMAVLLFHKKKISLCNIGDSKIFLVSNNDLQQISYDHVLSSVNRRKPPLTQNLGIPEEELTLSPYYAEGEYHAGDVYVICSDGLSDMIPIEELHQIIRTSSPDKVSDSLLQSALEHGGKDNITFIVLYIKKKSIFHI